MKIPAAAAHFSFASGHLLLCWFVTGLVPWPMDSVQIARLLAPFLDAPLSPAQLDAISAYLDLLLRWNQRINLTAVRRPEEIVTRHFGESLFLARQLFPPDARAHIVDLGSGAGFPGVPTAIYAPNAHVALIESSNKKAVFLRELTRALNLPCVTVFAGRGEDFLREQKGTPPDVVTLRAVEKFEAALLLAASFLRHPPPLRPGVMPDSGDSTQRRLALLIGAAQLGRAKSLLSDFAWQRPLPLPASESRVLLVGNLS